MKRTLLALMMAGLFAGAVSTATAKDDAAGKQPSAAQPSGATDPAATQKPSKGTTQMTPSGSGDSPSAMSKAEYGAAKDKANADYKDAAVKCETMQGESMRSCMSDAKKAQTVALSKAKSQWEGQSDMNATDGDTPGKPKPGKDAGKPANGDVNNSAGTPRTAQ